MDVDGGSTSLNEEVARSIPIQSGRSKASPSLQTCIDTSMAECYKTNNDLIFFLLILKFSSFLYFGDSNILSQVITTFLFMGAIFIPIGLVTLRASRNVVEIVERYDIECVPKVFRGNKVSYIKDSSISKNCTQYLKVDKYMKAPIYIYYQFDNYYQNHRRYVKSRSDKQFFQGLKYNDTSSCQPEKFNNGLPIFPCTKSKCMCLFNDTYIYSWYKKIDDQSEEHCMERRP